jgi:hypothetical protein
MNKYLCLSQSASLFEMPKQNKTKNKLLITPYVKYNKTFDSCHVGLFL